MASGRSSRRSIIIVAGVAVLMAAGGFFAAKLVISPEDAAARTAAPAAGPITVPVAKKALDSDIVTRGDIAFTGSVEVKLETGGTEGGASIVTGRIPEVGGVVENGTVLLEVTGRPVLALAGDLPTYRTLAAGSTGPDVEQLEATLAGLGYDPGPQDKTYDSATGAAVAKLYQTLGYEAPQPGDDVKSAVTSAQETVNAANQAVTEAQKALELVKAGPSQSERLTLQGAIDQAQAAYDSARNASTPPDQTAVEAANARVSAAQSQVDAAQLAFDNRIDDTDIAALQAALTGAAGALAAAQAALADASQPGPPDAAAIAAAKNALAVAKAQRDEALKVDSTPQQSALTAAQAGAATAQASLSTAQAAATTPLPASEVVWLASMPRRVDEVLVTRGATVNGAVLSVSGADLSVTAQVSADEAGLLQVGAVATLAVPGSADISAVVTQIGGAQPAAAQDGADPNAGSGDGGSSGTALILQPQNVSNEQAQALRGANVKVTIPVASTSGAVLVVPVAGLFSDAGGTPRVEVLQDDGSTRFQPVRLGLSTKGEVEVSPIDDQGNALQPGSATLGEGSLVVVGR